eukprot:TRINITY_DN11233_c0_g2_i1.p1 TRINITY_DN11233_c0_g2~~TRINITY_DN11233_c0_g2_i1.p1  ORF type:complete len:596 (-),score=77.97 TRINITY_DN11233_c0_g2_i1:26-1792(-)
MLDAIVASAADTCVCEVSSVVNTTAETNAAETSDHPHLRHEDFSPECLDRISRTLLRMEKNHAAKLDILIGGIGRLNDEVHELRDFWSNHNDKQANHEACGEQKGLFPTASQDHDHVVLESAATELTDVFRELPHHEWPLPPARQVQSPEASISTAIFRMKEWSVARLRSDSRQNTDDALKMARIDRESSRSESSGDTYGAMSPLGRVRHCAGRVVRWEYFDSVVGVVVLVNAVILGLRINGNANAPDAHLLRMIEEFILLLYICELLLRIFANGVLVFCDEFVVFDAVVVLAGIITFVEERSSTVAAYTKNTPSGALFVIRLARILRLVRAMRLVRQFEALAHLVNCMFHSLRGVGSVLVLLTLLLYIFSCLSIELIRDDPIFEHDQEIQEAFVNLPMAMLTLFAFVILDGMSDIYLPVILKQPWLFLYFISLILVVSISVVNVVTCYILQSSMAMTESDKEMDKRLTKRRIKQMAPEITEAFRILDVDGDGHITKEELISSMNQLPTVLTDHVKADSMLELFELLDEDDSGSISLHELQEHIVEHAVRQNEGQDHQVLKLLRVQTRRINELAASVEKIHRVRPVWL